MKMACMTILELDREVLTMHFEIILSFFLPKVVYFTQHLAKTVPCAFKSDI